ncbi:MAG: membrane protein insertion efficiency factor YidD [Rhodomicrobium sp.]
MEKYLKIAVKAPIYLYRYTISPLIGPRCRHLPTCSQYALDAIDLNGAWIGSWLAVWRILRCNPWGSHGFDPAPDLTNARIPFWAPWRALRCRRGVLR